MKISIGLLALFLASTSFADCGSLYGLLNAKQLSEMRTDPRLGSQLTQEQADFLFQNDIKVALQEVELDRKTGVLMIGVVGDVAHFQIDQRAVNYNDIMVYNVNLGRHNPVEPTRAKAIRSYYGQLRSSQVAFLNEYEDYAVSVRVDPDSRARDLIVETETREFFEMVSRKKGIYVSIISSNHR